MTVKVDDETKESRFIYLNGYIDEDKSKDIIEKLLDLQSEDPLDTITLVINSCGGEIYSMFAITDTMDFIYPDVRTICIGTTQSAAAFIFLCGEKGKRFITKHSCLMLHQVSGGIGGTTRDMDVGIQHVKYLQKQMLEEIEQRSNIDMDTLHSLIERDCYITPKQAVEYGLCDFVVEGRLS